MKRITAMLIAAALFFGLVADIVIGQPPNGERYPKWDEILKERSPSSFQKMIGIISIVANAMLLLILLIIYLQGFRKTKSFFMLGLSFFIGVLLMQKIMFFYFPLLPQFFETLALAILLVLSLE